MAPSAAILDRLVYNAYRLALKGESLRKVKPQTTTSENQDPSRRRTFLSGGAKA